MKFIDKTFVIFCFVFIGLAVYAQVNNREIKQSSKDPKISLKDISGDWFIADSSAYKISFVNLNNYIVDIHGIKHGVGNYSFRVLGDSVSATGSAPNWPPYYCTLRLLNKNLLEMAFFQFFTTEPTLVYYRR